MMREIYCDEITFICKLQYGSANLCVEIMIYPKVYLRLCYIIRLSSAADIIKYCNAEFELCHDC